MAGVWAAPSALRLLVHVLVTGYSDPPGGYEGLVSISSKDIKKLILLISVPHREAIRWVHISDLKKDAYSLIIERFL